MYRGLRVLRRWLRVASSPMPGAEHDARGAALVCEVVIQGPDYADRVLSKISVKYARISQNVHQISLNFGPNFVPVRAVTGRTMRPVRIACPRIPSKKSPNFIYKSSKIV